MNRLSDSVIHGPEFSKVAGIKLPKNSMDWNEAIIKQFYKEVQYISPNYGVDVVVNDIDDNAGYAKGSMVVWNNGKKVNYPIIIKDWELSPFDTFVIDDKESGDSLYISSNKYNLERALSDADIGVLTNSPSTYTDDDVKMPGGVSPKESRVAMGSVQQNSSFNKVSFDWLSTASSDHLEKFSEELQKSPGIRHSFIENNPDLITKIIDMGETKKVVPRDTEKGVLDTLNVFKRKQVETITDGEMFDTRNLELITPPALAEVRLSIAPTMEDVMGSGDTMIDRYTIAANGSKCKGVVVDHKYIDSTLKEKLFLSECGKKYIIGKEIYGVEFNASPDEFDSAVKVIPKKIPITGFDNNHLSGVDKVFPKTPDNINRQVSIDNTDSNYGYECDFDNGKLIVLYGASKAWEAINMGSVKYTRKIVESREVYTPRNNEEGYVLIKANIASPQIVETTNSPIYRVVAGRNKILLIPESSIIISTSNMSNVTKYMLTPESPIDRTFDKAGIRKVALEIGINGYKIAGAPIASLKKIAGMTNYDEFSTREAITALYTIGMSKEAANNALNTLIKTAASGKSNYIKIYGVNDDYITSDSYDSMQKEASISKLLGEYADSIRVNLIKEASVIKDPEVVDNVLSLNFINEDNIKEYAKYTDELEDTRNKLSEMLVASRMGLKDVEESALKKAIDGINEVIKGLSQLKLITDNN